MKNNEYNDLINKMKCTEEFRADMRKKLEAPPAAADDYGERVSGTELAPKRNVSRVIAWAASLFLVCGAVGGGVYFMKKGSGSEPSKTLGASSAAEELTTEEDTTADATDENGGSGENSPSDGYVEEISKEDFLAKFAKVGEGSFAQWLEGPTIVPQGNRPFDTVLRSYEITDPEAMQNELAELEWVSCSQEEAETATAYKDEASEGAPYVSIGGYNVIKGGIGLYRNGYIYCWDYDENAILNESSYYKLKNMYDVDKFDKILDKYFVMDKASEVADKIWKNIGNFKSLEADYVYEMNYGDNAQNARGTMKYDGASGKMHMDGEGLINGYDVTLDVYMKNGLPQDHDIWGPASAFQTKDKATGEIREILADYGYSSVMSYQPDFHYVYLAKNIERSIANAYGEFTNEEFEEKAVGENTEYYIKRTELYDESENVQYEGSTYEYTVVLDPEGRVISYEQIMHNKFGGDWGYSFKLENYKFDSDDFVMEDIEPAYDEIKEEYIKRSVADYDLPEDQ